MLKKFSKSLGRQYMQGKIQPQRNFEDTLSRIGLSGSCHWCAEAVFQSLIGVEDVKQGWLSVAQTNQWAEGILIQFDNSILPLDVLVAIHLSTHSSTSAHGLRDKYVSGLYYFTESQKTNLHHALSRLQIEYSNPIVTALFEFEHFRLNDEKYLN